MYGSRKRRIMALRVAFLLLLGPLSLAYGADVFSWVDEDGKVHYGDSVPERYKQRAKRLDPRGAVSAAQRQEAEARLARERARIESIRKAREDSLDEAAQSASAPTPAAPLASDSANICQEQLKKFLDSQACFAPYRLKDGGIKPEAFQRCTEVKEPRGCWQTPAPSDRNYMP